MNDHPINELKEQGRRGLCVFAVVMCITLAMVGVFYLPPANWDIGIAMILGAACVNAFLLLTYLMHFISERKLIWTVFAFTLFFFAGLMFLTLYANHDMPMGTMHH
jgi:FtsH-binding integral membrane protein